jgi:hypothetical protein
MAQPSHSEPCGAARANQRWRAEAASSRRRLAQVVEAAGGVVRVPADAAADLVVVTLDPATGDRIYRTTREG